MFDPSLYKYLRTIAVYHRDCLDRLKRGFLCNKNALGASRG